MPLGFSSRGLPSRALNASPRQPQPEARRHRLQRLLNAALLAVVVMAAGTVAAGSAPAQTLQERLNATEDKLSEVERKEGVLTTDISEASARISTLEGEVAELRNTEAVVAAELAAKQAELDDARARLVELRSRLQRAIVILEDRLVAIYKSGEPDLLTVVLEANGFDDVLERTEYMERLEDQDSSIVGQGPRAARSDAGARRHREGGSRRDRTPQGRARAHPR